MHLLKTSSSLSVPSFVGPEDGNFPRNRTIISTILFFVLYLSFGVILVRYPAPANRYIGVGISIALILCILLMLVLDFNRKDVPARHYRRNLSNTVVTVFLTIIILPVIYWLQWYPSMMHQTFQFSQDVVDSARFPSVAVFQQVNWTSQGNLSVHSSPPKCFINWLEETSTVSCDVSPSSDTPCNCTDSWSQDIDTIDWNSQTYRYLNMQASEAMTCTNSGTQMIVQVFFWYNSTRVLKDSDWVPNPSLYMAIYDPSLSLVEALEQNYTRMILVNANSMMGIDLGLVYRQNVGAAPAYDYDLFLSSVPAMDLVCDVGSTSPPPYGPCHISLFLQFPTFQRQISVLTQTMDWTDVVAAAGAYFSFIQVISWIISGMAFQT